MRYYRDMSEIQNGVDPGQAAIRMGEKIVVGTFIDVERPDFMENYRNMVLGKAMAKGKGKEKGRAA
jgi:hypothetical protein